MLGMDIMLKFLVIPATSASAIVACGDQAGPPSFESLPTPTTPVDFVQFVDESNLFAIDYPPD